MKIIFISLFLLQAFTIKAQSEDAKTILDKTIDIMKTNAVNSKTVDWNLLTAEAYKLAEKANGPEDLGNSIRYLLQSLGDFHGRFRYKDSIFRWRKEKVVVPDFYKAAFAQKDNKFFTSQLGDIGYLRIPATDQEIAKERAQALQDSICKLLSTNPIGLIFDLRLNGGGHVFSMIMGISNILQYGMVSPNGEVKHDGFYLDSKRILSFKETCERNHLDIPIVVITGPFTGSSAEGLAIILKNRLNTILIGEPTAGWVSSVNGFTINKNTGINLSIGYMTDVNNKVYTTKIQPGILVEGGDNFENLLIDAKIIKATQWLNNLKK
jgi:carboxyl-terminal processing protease